MTSTDKVGARPTRTIASQPDRLPARAKPLLASESLKRSVSGLRLTTANLADVVRLPTSGLNASTSRCGGGQRFSDRATLVEQQPCAQAAAADGRHSTVSGMGTRSARPEVTSMRR
jgi:hypothetical protein